MNTQCGCRVRQRVLSEVLRNGLNLMLEESMAPLALCIAGFKCCCGFRQLCLAVLTQELAWLHTVSKFRPGSRSGEL